MVLAHPIGLSDECRNTFFAEDAIAVKSLSFRLKLQSLETGLCRQSRETLFPLANSDLAGLPMCDPLRDLRVGGGVDVPVAGASRLHVVTLLHYDHGVKRPHTISGTLVAGLEDMKEQFENLITLSGTTNLTIEERDYYLGLCKDLKDAIREAAKPAVKAAAKAAKQEQHDKEEFERLQKKFAAEHAS